MEVDEAITEKQRQSEPSILKLIDHICNQSDIFFRSQQINDLELNYDEKFKIVKELLETNHATFLARYYKYMSIEHTAFFESQNYEKDEDYEIQYYLNKIKKSQYTQDKTIRNRRFSAMRKMIEENSNFFSEIEMMNREPLLYENLVGQYLTEQEKKSRDKVNVDNTFLNILMDGIDKNYAKELKKKQENEEKDDHINDLNEKPYKRHWGSFDEHEEEEESSKKIYQVPKFITEDERDLLKDEFKSIMYTRFLNGEENDFDYNLIDNSFEFDDLEQIDQDEQDRYFDEEKPNQDQYNELNIN